jgi:catechol 2,3-dioxygenase-like lactoylglutathione lyase family enzyme
MNFIRFEHINLSCQDIDASRQFYQTLFPDWNVRAEGGKPGDGTRWMHFGNRQFYLALNEAHGATRTHYPYEGIGVNHVGFVIEDGDKMQSLLDAHGIEYYVYTSPETKHRIYVNDPDGNEIELVQYQEAYELK